MTRTCGRRLFYGPLPACVAVLFALLLATGLSGCGEDELSQATTPVETTERQWHTEDEFLRDANLRATANEVVILHLSTGPKGLRVRHVIPFLFEETASYNFCIPAADPYIQSLELAQEGSPATAVHVERGGACETETITPGRYRLVVEHEGDGIGSAGTKAFVHVPRVLPEDGLQAAAGSLLNSLPLCVNPFPSASFWGSVNNPLLTLAVSGSYIAAAQHPSTRTSYPLPTTSSTQNSLNAWSICRLNAANSGVAFFNGIDPSNVRNWLTVTASAPNTIWDSYPACNGGTAVCPFTLNDLGNAQFTLSATGNDLQTHPVTSGSGGLILGPTGTPGTVLTVLYKAYRKGAVVPAAQAGEVALLNATCGQAAAATYVVETSLPNLTQAGISGFGTLIVRPGPGTAAVAYSGLNYTGTPTYIFQETCLNGLPASLAIMPINRDFVVATKTCIGCDLSGIDFSNVDLTAGNFTATVFNGGNFTNTNFQAAILDQAQLNSPDAATVLTNTDFRDARLYCTSFQKSELRQARFWANVSPPIVPVIKRDFSCRLQLQNASIDGNTFPIKDWHYLTLDGAVIHDVSGQTLSTTSSPLDLSQARLRGTQGLTHVTLAGAILSGADFTGTDLTSVILDSATASANLPAVFNSATLTYASLKSASLSGSFFRGAVLNPANLGSTDLSGAWMEDDGSGQFGRTVLSGSYMMNTKLNLAHLTDAVLDTVSWYNTNSMSPIATGAGALLTGASFNLADLPGLDLSGAYLQGARFTNTQLIGANLAGAHVGRNGTSSSDLSTANLAGAILTSTDLTYANLQNAKVAPQSASEIYIEVLADPDHYQKGTTYQYFAVNRPATVLGTNGTVSVITTSATCPSGATGPCGDITSSKWVAQNPPQEPTDCMPTAYDAQGNVIAITCSSSRHPT